MQLSTSPESIANNIHPLFLSAHWGMHVIDSDSKQVLYTHNASQLFIPASITKLFTTAAALELLGPSHMFYTHVKTSLLTDNEGIVKGDLHLIGGGDPSLTSEGLQELANVFMKQASRQFLEKSWSTIPYLIDALFQYMGNGKISP